MQLLVFFYPPFSDTNTNINFWNKQLSNYRMARVCVETTEKDVSQDCSGHPPLPLLLGLFFFFVIDSFLEIIYQEPSVHNNHKWFPVPFFFVSSHNREIKVQRHTIHCLYITYSGCWENPSATSLENNMKTNEEQTVIKIRLEQNTS